MTELLIMLIVATILLAATAFVFLFAIFAPVVIGGIIAWTSAAIGVGSHAGFTATALGTALIVGCYAALGLICVWDAIGFAGAIFGLYSMMSGNRYSYEESLNPWKKAVFFLSGDFIFDGIETAVRAAIPCYENKQYALNPPFIG